MAFSLRDIELKKSQIIGLILGVIIIGIAYSVLKGTPYYLMGMGAGVLVGALPFVIDTIKQTKIEHQKEQMFLEFSRDLVESVKTGTPISKSIINMKSQSYGVLGRHVEKLGNQISMGVPLTKALQIFSKDVENKTISRALTLIGQAERAGGDIGEILESVAGAVSMSDKLKKERKATISTLVVQSYIIFFVFMAIVLIMQFQIIPMVSGIADVGVLGSLGGGGGEAINQEQISNVFLYMLLVQGFFTGLTVGKLSEGSIKPGIKHSFILMFAAFIVSTGANLIFSAGGG